MPQAPDLVPTAVPSATTPEVSLAVPTDAFGGAVGAALQHMGASLESDSDKIWQRAMEMQELQNRTEVDNADSKFIEQTALAHARFNAQQGTNAGPEALKAHIDEVEGIRKGIREGLSNPASQRMFNSTSLSTMGRYISNASNHSAIEVKNAYRQGLSTHQGTLANEVADSPDDPQPRRAFRAVTATIAREKGLPEEDVGEFIAQAEAPVNFESVKRALEKNPYEGKKMLDDYHAQGKLVGKEYSAALEHYQQQALNIIPDQIGGQVTADLKNQTDPERTGATLQEREQQAADIATEKFPDIPRMATEARRAARASYNDHLSAVRDLNWRDRKLVGDILEGNYSPDGKAPTKMEEVRAAPGGADSVKRLTYTQLQSVNRALMNNAMGKKYAATPESDAEFYKLYGQLTSDDPDTRAAALDVFVPELKLPQDQRTKLRNLQTDLHSGTPQDPRIGQAMQEMKPSMEGMSTGDRDKFRGAMSVILQDAISKNQGKSTPLPEVRQIGARLLQNMPSGHWYTFDSKLFEEPIPSDILGKMKLKAAIEGRAVTDEQLQSEFTRQRYNELQDAAKKTRQSP